jgi:hypothetical protein
MISLPSMKERCAVRHKRQEFLLHFIILGVILTATTLPAHAVPITIVDASREVSAESTLGTGPTFTTSSLGFFSEISAVSVSAPPGSLSISASQISDISSTGDVLTIISATSAHYLKISPIGSSGMSASAGSGLSLVFTIDNWASYDAQSILNGGSPFAVSGPGVLLFNLTTGEPVFSLGPVPDLTDSRTGLLSPGSYSYVSDSNIFAPDLDDLELSPSVLSSLKVSIVPEPSSLLLLTCGFAMLAGWRFRTFAV